MSGLNKSTIVRIRNGAMNAFFKYGEYVAPNLAGRLACDLWFTAPPRMADSPVPEGGAAFEVTSQGATVVGRVWVPRGVSTGSANAAAGAAGAEEIKTVYLMHGWGGRGSQFGAMVEPLVAAGYRVVTFDAPAHGDSDRVPGVGKTANGIQFAKALDAVVARFGPAEAVIAHSLGTIATYLELRFGWLGTKRLIFIAPMVEAISLFDMFQSALGFGPRTRRAFDQAVLDSVGLPVGAFDARVQANYSALLPTLVFADRSDRQTPYDDAADFAGTVGAEFVTTEGLGHRKILRDRAVIARVLDFVAGSEPVETAQMSKKVLV